MQNTQIQQTPQAVAFFTQAQQLAENLYVRWQNEKDYEDIADYAKCFAQIAQDTGCTIVRGTKRPFGVVFAVLNSTRTFQLRVTNTQYSYKRLT